MLLRKYYDASGKKLSNAPSKLELDADDLQQLKLLNVIVNIDYSTGTFICKFCNSLNTTVLTCNIFQIDVVYRWNADLVNLRDYPAVSFNPTNFTSAIPKHIREEWNYLSQSKDRKEMEKSLFKRLNSTAFSSIFDFIVNQKIKKYDIEDNNHFRTALKIEVIFLYHLFVNH